MYCVVLNRYMNFRATLLVVRFQRVTQSTGLPEQWVGGMSLPVCLLVGCSLNMRVNRE